VQGVRSADGDTGAAAPSAIAPHPHEQPSEDSKDQTSPASAAARHGPETVAADSLEPRLPVNGITMKSALTLPDPYCPSAGCSCGWR